MTGSVSGCWSVWAKERLARQKKAIKKTYFFIGKRFCWAKVGNSPEKFIINNKFAYFCSVNWDNCMDGKSQIQQEERIKILQSLMPEVFDVESANLRTNTALHQMRDAGVEFRTI